MSIRKRLQLDRPVRLLLWLAVVVCFLVAVLSFWANERPGYKVYRGPIEDYIIEESKKQNGIATEPDKEPAFRIQPNDQWALMLRRGSGWHGYDTIIIDDTGRVNLVSHSRQRWYRASVKISPATVKEILDGIEHHKVLEAQAVYSSQVCDGEQWEIHVQQGNCQKRIYCSNAFPTSLVNFAHHIDDLLIKNTDPNFSWQRAIAWDERDCAEEHVRECWNAKKERR